MLNSEKILSQLISPGSAAIATSLLSSALAWLYLRHKLHTDPELRRREQVNSFSKHSDLVIQMIHDASIVSDIDISNLSAIPLGDFTDLDSSQEEGSGWEESCGPDCSRLDPALWSVADRELWRLTEVTLCEADLSDLQWQSLLSGWSDDSDTNSTMTELDKQ